MICFHSFARVGSKLGLAVKVWRLRVGLLGVFSVRSWIDGWMDGWMDGWIDGWMDGWVGGWFVARFLQGSKAEKG